MARLVLKEVEAYAQRLGLTIATYNPGDGRRYRVFLGVQRADFHQGDGLFSSMKLGEISAFIRGYGARYYRED